MVSGIERIAVRGKEGTERRREVSCQWRVASTHIILLAATHFVIPTS
jgi:hypothetical protein